MGFSGMHVGIFLKRSWCTAHLVFMLVYGGYNFGILWDTIVESWDA